MSQKIQSRWIADNAVILSKISAAARTGILAGKLIAARKAVLNFSAPAASSVDVSTQIAAAATTNTPVTDLTALGVYTGALSNGPADSKVVLVRIAASNEGVDDGDNNEVYGHLTEASGVYTLNFLTSAGAPYSFPTGTAIDFYFVEVMDLSTVPVEALLFGSVAGVVDAQQATTLAGHLNGGPSKHDASEIDVESDGSYYNASDLESVLADLDAGIASAAAAAGAAQSTIDNHLNGGANKHDASEIDVEATTGNYYDAGDLETALYDIDAALKTVADSVAATLSEEAQGQAFVLSGTDITNKYVDLPSVPKVASLVRMAVMGGLEQDYAVDFAIVTNGTDLRRLTWDNAASGGPSVGMVADLQAGDKLRVYWQIDN